MSDPMDKNTKETLDRIAKRLDMILVVLLAKSDVNQSEIARILGTTERTIRNWLPFRQIQQSGKSGKKQARAKLPEVHVEAEVKERKTLAENIEGRDISS